MNLILSGHLFPLFPFFVFRVNASRRLPQASARRLPFGHPRICSQITGDSALQCWSGCEISPRVHHFYSRPCGRGDKPEDATSSQAINFYSRPCGRGDTPRLEKERKPYNFYSRPCGRGDSLLQTSLVHRGTFLLTPLREGRPLPDKEFDLAVVISTHAPAGGATDASGKPAMTTYISTHAPAGGATKGGETPWDTMVRFLLTPLREGRRCHDQTFELASSNFYSRPCGRGDDICLDGKASQETISTHAPAGGATLLSFVIVKFLFISTHAPAGGATAIFHKSVMRFCGKLPKDDTVLCLASFGFPRRDPKAVYLAWISCANLPQKCVRQGLALKDQGTSCFHEGLASHAFDPVLV